MDFSKYQKVSSDDKITTLMHPDGHEIKIAHAALNPKMRDTLMKLPMAMAEGGSVEAPKKDQPVINVNIGGQPQGQVAPEISQAIQPNLQATAQDFAALPNAKPAMTPYEQQLAAAQSEFPGLAKAVGPEAEVFKQAAQKQAEKQVVQQEQQQAQQQMMEQSQTKELLASAQSKLKTGAPLTPDEQAALAKGPELDPRQKAFEMAQAELAKPQQQGQQRASMLQSGLGKYESGLQQEAQVAGQLGKEQAAIMEQGQQKLQETLNYIKERETFLRGELETARQDFQNGTIDPKRYLNNMSGGERVMTAIGLFLGGLGGGLLGKGNNIALDFLNQQIERDVQSQEKEVGRKENLVNFYFKQLGDLRQASEMARIQSKEAVAAQMEQASLKITDKIKKAQVDQAIGKIRLENADKINQMATSFGDAQLQKIMQLPKELREPALKELGEVKNIESAVNRVKVVMNDLKSLQTIGSRAGSPIQSSSLLDKAEADLFPIVKQIVGERMTDSDARILIKTNLPKFLDSKGTIDKKTNDFIQSLYSQISGRAPILSSTGIVNTNKKFDVQPRGK